MTPDQFRRIDEIFNAAREMEPDERAEYLSAACGHDSVIRREVEAMLSHDEKPRGFLKTPAINAGIQFSSMDGVIGSLESAPTPEIIGGYRIVRVLGEGGFGIVYLALQEKPRRTIALKVVRAELASPQMLRRFEYEAQVLGRLAHPGIAQIYEAGTDQTSQRVRAFFAMEYIEGKRLDQYVHEKALEIPARLELVAKICDAVQYAHQKGVIHRDLKPQNILVDQHDQPKILDFGVSRAADPDIYTTTLHTTHGQLIGTLPYMSPEQVSGDPAEVDTRSDVYTLGVILYQLLTGKLPHDLSARPLPEAARMIRDDQPTRLSSISRALRGDVDTIVSKAMEKDKLHRYQSAADLAADIRRHLSGEPIEAKRGSGWYVLQKTIRRYKMVTAFSLAIVVILIGASVALGVLYRRAEHESQVAQKERDRARIAEKAATDEAEVARTAEKKATREARRAQLVNNYLNRMLQSADARSAQGEERTVRQVVDSVVDHLEDSFKEEPLIEASVRATLGNTYSSLGLYEKAMEQHGKALALRQAAYDGGDEEVGLDLADSLQNYAVMLTEFNRLEEAESYMSRALSLHRKLLPENAERLAWDLSNLSMVRMKMGKDQDVEAMLEEAVKIARVAPKEDGPEAEEDSQLVTSLNTLVYFLNSRREFEKAEKVCREALELCRQRLGENHPLIPPIYNNLAATVSALGREEESMGYYQKSLDAVRRILGDDHPDVANALCGVAQANLNAGRNAEAEKYYSEALAIRRKALPAGHPTFAIVLTGLGRAMVLNGKAAEAEPVLREGLAIREATTPPGDFTVGLSNFSLGACLVEETKYDEAEPLLLKAYNILLATRGPDFVTTINAAKALARLYDARGDRRESKKWTEKAASAPASQATSSPVKL